jgi:4-hydroxybenzoate polyprenyltransferase
MKKYIRIMRLDHWIKQLFILPGFLCAFVLVDRLVVYEEAINNLVVGFLATCFIASANYVINEWLDAEFDKYHPTKKHRSVVEEGADKRIVYALYIGLAVIGIGLASTISRIFCLMEVWLWVMGILYNVKPIRTKDIPFLDVLSESVNNAIRLLIGWFIVTSEYQPPISLVIGYWFAGAFLMATKRFSEYRMINNPELAGKYRRSFKYYTQNSLLLSSFLYAMISTFFIGIFLIKYRVELILFMPLLMGLFCYYFWISFKEDSAAQKPEKLYKEKGLMLYVIGLCIVFLILMCVHIEELEQFTSVELFRIR